MEGGAFVAEGSGGDCELVLSDAVDGPLFEEGRGCVAFEGAVGVGEGDVAYGVGEQALEAFDFF